MAVCVFVNIVKLSHVDNLIFTDVHKSVFLDDMFGISFLCVMFFISKSQI